MHVTTIPPDEASGLVREHYQADVAKDGYVHHYTELFSLNPEAYSAWGALIGSIRGRLDLRRYELATLAAAIALRCRYCVSAHGNIIESRFYSREQLERIVSDYRNAGLAEVDVAIMAFAEKIALHAYKVTPEDVAGLREHGMDDQEIFNIALTAAARCFFSKALDAMGAQPDEAFGSSSELFELVQATPLPTG